MGKPILLNALNLLIFLLLFIAPVSAQSADISEPQGFNSSKAIPTETFYKPKAKLPVSPTISPTGPTTTAIPTQLESNILGVQTRNPAPIVIKESSVGAGLFGNFIGLLLLVGVGYWIYKKKGSFEDFSKK